MSNFYRPLTTRPFDGLYDLLYGNGTNDRENRLRAAQRATECVSVKVTSKGAEVYRYLPAGEVNITRQEATDHLAAVRDLVSNRRLTTGERNAARSLASKLESVAA
jgi:hypothetical protein